ncbi:hypothetical protein BCR42DRAFT_412318 [Absidia repens]|uniref:Uncharacterized protein n=1 Tax=Absidia repens TaxID=90262 RepID=A0A1X2IJH0_9FUNG|nr:hypothetical protein BCR42DRAFT_412318 [Absidia repens]
MNGLCCHCSNTGAGIPLSTAPVMPPNRIKPIQHAIHSSVFHQSNHGFNFSYLVISCCCLLLIEVSFLLFVLSDAASTDPEIVSFDEPPSP